MKHPLTNGTKQNQTLHICGPYKRIYCTVLELRVAHRKWKETKQLPSILPGLAVPGSCLLSFHILWAILITCTVQPADIGWPTGNGKKLSCSQAQLGQATCLAAA